MSSWVLLARQEAASWRQLPASQSVDPSLLHGSCNLSPGSHPGAIDPLAQWPLTRQAFSTAATGAGCPGLSHHLPPAVVAP